jgi:hypothetical protein
MIDETSLLFATEAGMRSFVRWSVGLGMQNFNSQRDVMQREWELSNQAFSVAFEFLRWPESPWRIECMVVLDGEAPIHEAALRRLGNGCVVHASFKCVDDEAYVDACAVLSKQLREEAAYRNSYGQFSYWTDLNRLTKRLPFFKPRLNLRDVAGEQSV